MIVGKEQDTEQKVEINESMLIRLIGGKRSMPMMFFINLAMQLSQDGRGSLIFSQGESPQRAIAKAKMTIPVFSEVLFSSVTVEELWGKANKGEVVLVHVKGEEALEGILRFFENLSLTATEEPSGAGIFLCHLREDISFEERLSVCLKNCVANGMFAGICAESEDHLSWGILQANGPWFYLGADYASEGLHIRLSTKSRDEIEEEVRELPPLVAYTTITTKEEPIHLVG